MNNLMFFLLYFTWIVYVLETTKTEEDFLLVLLKILIGLSILSLSIKV